MDKRVFLLPKLLPRDRQICNVVDALEELPISEGWRVEIREHKATRNDKQNNTLWWLYGEIIKIGGNLMAGWTKENLHDFFLGRHFGITRKIILGEVFETPTRRSSKLSKIDFATFVDSIYNFMASQGVILPQPDRLFAAMNELAAF